MSAAAPPAPPASAGALAALAAHTAAHEKARDERAFEAAQRAGEALALAEEIEGNARAMVGLELNAAIANQNELKGAVRQLRAQVGAMTRASAGHARAYGALAAAAADAGGHRAFLDEAGAAHDRANADLAFVAERLTRE
jgi:hypothetical protein